jgi:hypothetical protein
VDCGSIPSGEHEAARDDQRGSDSGCGADACVAPVEAVVDRDDDRLGGRVLRGRSGVRYRAQGAEGDRYSDRTVAACDRAHAGRLRRVGRKPWWSDLNRGKTAAFGLLSRRQIDST